MVASRIDPVTSRLAAAEHTEPSLIIDWLEARQARDHLRRRAFWCNLGSWLLVTAAAVIGSAVAVKFSYDTRRAFGQGELNLGYSYFEVAQPPVAIQLVPPLLTSIAAVLLMGGLLAWMLGRFPGHSWACSAIDWSNVSDAVWRLLAVGCTYSEAFETAEKVSRSPANRQWLRQAKQQVELGKSEFKSAGGNGDAMMLEMLVTDGDTPPCERWRLAETHFGGVARRRVAMLQATVPIVATLVAGLLIWLSISATLGWMWFSIGKMIGGLSG